MSRPWQIKILHKPGKLPGHLDYIFIDFHTSEGGRLFCIEQWGTPLELEKVEEAARLIVGLANSFGKG